MKKSILTSDAPQPIGPYSQAIRAGDWLFCSGQIPLEPKTLELIGSTAAEQSRQVLHNLEAVLKAAGSDLEQVVKTTIFLKNLSDFNSVNAVYAEFFKNSPPARSTIEVSALPKNALVEIECIAQIKPL